MRIGLSCLGLEEITPNLDPRLIEAVGAFFEENFRSVRFLQIEDSSVADRIARLYAPRARAYAWSGSVLFPAGRESIWQEPWREENARTIAHELWHILELREFGLLRWSIVFVRAWRRHGPRTMRHAHHEIRARTAAEAFLSSEEFEAARPVTAGVPPGR